jgi:hypothetical protein
MASRSTSSGRTILADLVLQRFNGMSAVTEPAHRHQNGGWHLRIIGARQLAITTIALSNISTTMSTI